MPYQADEFTGRTFGKYEILCRMTVGGMAEIFLAFARSGPFAYKPVVLKRILAEHREDDSSIQMLIDEAKITATLNHENVARVLDLEIAGAEVLLVIEFISGATLDELAQVAHEKNEVLPLGFVLTAIRECAQGLHHAHSHKDGSGRPMPVIHRDVTPKNLMIDFEGIAKVLDFGIARAMGATRRTVAGMVRGTSAYMSPEQAIDGKMDIRTDIFSLGTIFHELLTGQRLFYRGSAGKEMAAVYEAEVPPPSLVNRRVPDSLDPVVLKALERSLTKRYQSSLELVRDISLAASSTAWPTTRCAQWVRQRFAPRRDEVLKLIGLMQPDSQSHHPLGRRAVRNGVPTQPTTPALSPALPQTVSHRPGSSEANTDENRHTDDQSVPTKFFTPEFPGDSSPSQPKAQEKTSILSLGVVPELSDSYDQQKPTRVDTDSRVRPEPITSPTGSPAVPRPLDRWPPPRPVRGTSPFGVAIAAIGALVVGAIGGVVIHRSFGGGGKPARPASAVGRLSLQTDRAAEVQLEPNLIVRSPVVDVLMSPGTHHFRVREPNGPWLALEVDVKSDSPTQLKVKLDALRPIP